MVRWVTPQGYRGSQHDPGGEFFEYSASDGIADSDPIAVELHVQPTNNAPVATPEDYKVISGETLVVVAPGVLSNDSDVDGDVLTAILDSTVSNGSLVLKERVEQRAGEKADAAPWQGCDLRRLCALGVPFGRTISTRTR